MQKNLLCLFLLFLTPLVSFPEGQPQPELGGQPPGDNQDPWSEFYQVLAELQVINSELGIRASVLMSSGQPLSDNDEKWIERQMRRAMELLRQAIEQCKKLPIRVKGFSAGYPSGITIDFEFEE